MPNVLRNCLAILAGVFVGSVVNFVIILAGPMIIPLPEGIDLSDMERFAENLQRLPPQNFIAPWLAHALGTLVGAAAAARLAANHSMAMALAVSVFFLAGGVAMIANYGGPIEFAVLDLVGAYVPMALLGSWLGRSGVQHSTGEADSIERTSIGEVNKK